MGVIENAKEVAELIKQYNNLELNKKVLALENDLAELQREKRRLEAENDELKAKLRLREEMQFRAPYSWREGDDAPYCPRCAEADGKAIHLSPPLLWSGGIKRKCPNCTFEHWEEPPKSARAVVSHGIEL